MKVNSNSVTTVTIELTEEEAVKLGGLLAAVPTNDEFFDDLSGEINFQTEQLFPDYAVDESGDYVVVAVDEETL